MKKLATIIALSLTTMGSLSALDETTTPPAKVKDHFGYVDLGLGPAPLPLPIFGLGQRTQRGSFGFDTNLRVSTIYYYTQVKANLLLLHYFKPNSDKQFYMGIGPGIAGIYPTYKKNCLEKGTYTVSPEVAFGKEYKSDTEAKRFFQAQIGFPTYYTKKIKNHEFDSDHLVWYPSVTLHYGWGF